LNDKVFIQGYYQNVGAPEPMDNFGLGGCLFATGISTNTTDADYVTLSLMDPTTYALVESQTGTLQTNGTVSVNFTTVMPGSAYYIRFTHRNSIETWTANPVMLSATTTHDWTTSQSNAFGGNMVEVETGVWAVYSGDIADANLGVGFQDGVVESTDYSEMENSVYSIDTGYIPQDISGDGVVESTDYSIMENNVYFIIFSQHP
jgi:hypothetical protein